MSNLTLCYHALSNTWPAALAVPVDRFERQIKRLVARGYSGATFSEVARGEASGRVVAITFDDAFESVKELALPVLRAHGFPATVFVPTDYPDSGRPMTWEGLGQWDPEYRGELGCMSWSDLRELRAEGWEIGSHTRSHPYLTNLGDDQLREELSGSREACAEGIGAVCTTIAYPYGDTDTRVRAAAAAAGYELAAALGGRFDYRAPLLSPRIGIYQADDRKRFEAKISPATIRLRSSRLWGKIEALRAQRRAARAVR